MRKEMLLAISSSLPDVSISDEPLSALLASIERVSSDAMLIYGHSTNDAINKVKEEMAGLAPDIISGLGKHPGYGSMRIAAERVTVYSGRLSLSGSIDRVYDIGGSLIPAYVSGSKPPAEGAYASDRIRLAAYAMLAGERYGQEVSSGYVEYFPGWCIREVGIRKKDRWAALSLRNRVMDMKEGRMPDVNRGKQCDRCEFRPKCGVRVSFLDGLFG